MRSRLFALAQNLFDCVPSLLSCRRIDSSVARLTSDATRTLVAVAEALEVAKDDWWLIGGAAVALHGLDIAIADIDVVMSLGMGAGRVPSDVEPVPQQVVWYENVGRPGRGTSWKKHVLTSPFDQAFEAVAADLDGDGLLDVIATGWGSAGQLAWLRNPGKAGAAWALHRLKSDWPNAVQVIAADLDGDGRKDVVAVAEDGVHELRWWRNQGVGPVQAR